MPQNADDRQRAKRPNLKEFDAYAERNGQDLGQDEARDLGRPAILARERESDPAWQAETPPENLRHIGDARSSTKTP